MATQQSRAVATRPAPAAPAMNDDAAQQQQIEAIWSYLDKGDLNALPVQARARIYVDLCHALGLNPKLRPLQVIYNKGKAGLYITKAACDTVAENRKLTRRVTDDPHVLERKVGTKTFYVIEMHVEVTDGRRTETELYVRDFAMDEAYAIQIRKATSAAKRRLTLGFLAGPTHGLWLEDDIEEMPDAKIISADKFVNDAALDVAEASYVEADAVEESSSEEPEPAANGDEPQLTQAQRDLYQFCQGHGITAEDVMDYLLFCATQKMPVTPEKLLANLRSPKPTALPGLYKMHFHNQTQIPTATVDAAWKAYVVECEIDFTAPTALDAQLDLWMNPEKKDYTWARLEELAKQPVEA